MTGRAKLEAEGLFRLKEKPGPGFCCVAGCKRKHGPEKRYGKLCLCPAHYMQRWRTLNSRKAGFATLRDHAKARKLPFTIGFDYYLGFMDAAACFDTGAESRGDIVTIDRKDPSRGYEPGNLQVLTLSDNVAKGNRERFLPDYVQSLLCRKRAKVQREAWAMQEPDYGDDPF